MKVMKFGGTSVGNGKRMVHVARIISNYAKKERIITVVSAMSGVTDNLIAIFQKYKEGKFKDASSELDLLYKHHIKTLNEFGLSNSRKIFIQNDLMELFGGLMKYLSVNKKYDRCDCDYIISYGERFSCLLLVAALEHLGLKAEVVDSSRLLVTSEEFGNAQVYLEETKKKAEKIIFSYFLKGILPIVTGFYGATKNGKIATLGRGGSDYSATVLAYVLDAPEVLLWKEVDGIFSTDPKNDEKARFKGELSYSEALKLAQNGAKILHPETIKPIAEKEIIVWVKNTFNPDFIGTKIWKGK